MRVIGQEEMIDLGLLAFHSMPAVCIGKLEMPSRVNRSFAL